jgi:hypothetical protein
LPRREAVNEGKKESKLVGSCLKPCCQTIPSRAAGLSQRRLSTGRLLGFDGGRTRARTLDPLIKSPTSALKLLGNLSNRIKNGPL